ncbi:hypothetical protein D6C84_07066 [Aureobasidium pullulans]|uniref:Apple domain-containing protein n=1 Tax=Aureobasidium pullulans TaxID=5580 RepID=A0A4S9XM64_AURPU|nr:hypothetical protein D6C84_07066 [Aureobasidium pullulans]
MHASRILSVISFMACVMSVYSSPLLDERAALKCASRDIAIVRRTISDETYFCKWWLSDVRTRSPFLEVTPAQVTNLCKCVTPVKTTTKHKRAGQTEQATLEHHLERRQTKASCRAEMSIQFTEPWHFCVFYNSYPRTSSPFAKYAAKDLVNLCNCIEGKIVSTSTKKTSTSIKKTSTQKISASTKKVSTSTKKTLTSTTSKKTSSSPSRTSSISSQSISGSSTKASSKSSTTPSSLTRWLTLPTPWTPPSSSMSSTSSDEKSSSAAVGTVSESSSLTSSEPFSTESTTSVSSSTTEAASTTSVSTISAIDSASSVTDTVPKVTQAPPLPESAHFKRLFHKCCYRVTHWVHIRARGLDGFPSLAYQGDMNSEVFMNATYTDYPPVRYVYDQDSGYIFNEDRSYVLSYYTDYDTSNGYSRVLFLNAAFILDSMDTYENWAALPCSIDQSTSEMYCFGATQHGETYSIFASQDSNLADDHHGVGRLYIASSVSTTMSPLDLFVVKGENGGQNVPSTTETSSTTDSSQTATTTESQSTTSSSAAATPTSVCGTVYTDDSASPSLSYDISCTLDYSTGSFPAIITDSLDDCIAACSLDSDDGCVAAVWFQSGRNQQYCYLKTEDDLNSQTAFSSTDVAFSATRRDL